jgi:hypothetical protein
MCWPPAARRLTEVWLESLTAILSHATCRILRTCTTHNNPSGSPPMWLPLPPLPRGPVAGGSRAGTTAPRISDGFAVAETS